VPIGELAIFRQRILRVLASYTSIDDALLALEPGEPDEVRLLDEFASASMREEAAGRITYLEACMLERARRHLEAAGKLGEVAALDPESPEPVLRLAECLRAAGEARNAETELRAAIDKGLGESGDLWTLWGAVSLGELALPPAQVLQGFRERENAAGEDLRWLLERLMEDSPIRILCGSDADRVSKGGVWGRDRFFDGGFSARFPDRVGNTDDPVLYETERCFPKYPPTPAYRIPLPRATYKVTLHFAEHHYRTPGSRSFGARIEGEGILKDYDMVASRGFFMADVQRFEAEVKDGMLDIEFVHGVEDPAISAIEIERGD